MLAALLDDKTEFVELFLQNGLSMREFLTPQILCQLYTGVSTELLPVSPHPPWVLRSFHGFQRGLRGSGDLIGI